MSPGVTKISFILQVCLLAVLHVSLLLRRVLRSWGREEVVVITIMPQLSIGDTNNNLNVYLYRLFAFGILVIVSIQLE